MGKKLGIAVWHNLPSGGGKRALYNQIKGLIDRGHYVESWCPDTADQQYLPLNQLIKENIVPLKFPNKFNRQPIYEIIKNYNIVKVLSKVLDEHNKECARQIHQGDFDILFANTCIFFRTTSIGKFVKLPSLLYLQEPYRWFYEAMPELPWLYQKNGFQKSEELIKGTTLQARYELEYAKAFDLILVNSIYSRESILRVYNLESKVCYLGIDTDFYQSTGEKKGNFVVGLGTIYHAKGVDRAIKALGSIPENIRPDLVWIGNGAWPDDLKGYQDLAKKLGVNFTPRLNISDGEVKSLLSRAILLIYTSRLEPFGFAPLEANACGTPVVGIAEGGMKETIVDGVNGYVVNDLNPESIGTTIISMLTDKSKLAELGKRSRKYVETQWNLETSVSNIERALYSVKNSEPVLSTSRVHSRNTFKTTDTLKTERKTGEHREKETHLLRLIAFYLPQFHPIPENDQWWGKGFTEWTNVSRAKPCFPGHYQPQLPTDLGFYDLRVPEVREAQAELAREHGIYGFCYYHYDFAGKRLLEQPFHEVLHSGKPDFPFCLCWANENWTKTWDGLDQEILIQQHHSAEDDRRFIRDIIPAFQDKRYIRVNGKLLLVVYRTDLLPDIQSTTSIWRETVKKELQEELYLCTVNQFIKDLDPRPLGFDATIQFAPDGRGGHIGKECFASDRKFSLDEMADNNLYDYASTVKFMVNLPTPPYTFFRGVFPAWDNTPRRQNTSTIFINSTPEQYSIFLKKTIELTFRERCGDERLIFMNAWNEWAEGAYLEPNQQYGNAYLLATKEAVEASRNSPEEFDARHLRSRRIAYRLSVFPRKILKKMRSVFPKKQKVFGSLDQVEWNAKSVQVAGWTLSDKGIKKIEVYVNDHFVGNAAYGICRPDVKQAYPSLENSEHAGFQLRADISGFSQGEKGKHNVVIKVIDNDGQNIQLKSSISKG